MPSTSVPPPIARCSGTQAAGRPRRQSAHSPQDGAQESTTSSPAASPRTRVPDRLDDARALVPEHHRRRPLELALDAVEIGAADPDRGHAHEHVGRPGIGDLDLLDRERPAGPRRRRRGSSRAAEG